MLIKLDSGAYLPTDNIGYIGDVNGSGEAAYFKHPVRVGAREMYSAGLTVADRDRIVEAINGPTVTTGAIVG